MKRILGTLYVLLLAAQLSVAQYTSGVEGTALDQTGSPLPNAKVLVTNEATQVTRETTTNGSGYFRASELLPGIYRVEVQLVGFQNWVERSVQIDANQMRSVYPKLQVGEQSAHIEVSATAEGIETGKSSVATSIAAATMETAPMPSRNIYAAVAFIAPGVTGAGKVFGSGSSAGQDSFQAEPGFQINSAGQRQETNEYQVDGSSVNGNSRDGIANLTPEPDTVQEMRVSAASFTAERGHNSGALIEVYTKSGTNDLHGTLSEFHTNNQLTSRTVFQSAVPVFRRNEFGFTAGGPAIKNRTFLFGSYHRLASSASQTDVVPVETPQFLSFLKQNYPNNISTRILSTAVPGAYPVANFLTVADIQSRTPGRNPVPASWAPNMPVLGTAFINETLTRPAGQWNTRLDQYARSFRDRVFFNYFNYFSNAQTANPRPIQRITQPNYGMYGKANWSHTFSPSLVNEASMTLGRVDGATPPTVDPSLPSITVTGLQGFSQSQIGWVHANYNWHDVVSWMRGNHSLKFGVDIDRQHDLDNFTPSYARPTFTFANVLDFAQDTPYLQSGPTIDTRTQTIANNLYTRVHMTYVSGFIQDDWKVRRNFTLNLGLRYEYYGHVGQVDRSGTPLSLFTPGTGATFNEQIASGSMRVTGNGLVSTNTPQGWNPRIGFGWDVFGNGSLAVRGGYGWFYNRVGDLSWAGGRANPPFGQVTFDVRNGQTLKYSLGSPNGLFFPLPDGVQFKLNDRGGLVGTPLTVYGVNPQFDEPRVQVWNLQIQKSLTKSIIVEADYIGNHGNNLYLQTNANRFAGDLLAHNGSLTRLNPAFGPIIYGRTIGYSDGHYGSFLVSKRFSKGISAKGVYTFGKSTDLTSSNDNGVAGGQNVFDVANPFAQHARSDYNVARRFTFDAVYAIPSPFRNELAKRIAGGWELSAIAILQSGLPFSVITTAPYPKGDFNADGQNYDAPNTPAFGNSKSSSRSNFLTGIFPVSAFPLPSPGQEGNLGRNTFDGPGLANINLNIVKNTKVPWFVREGATLQIRGEVFNLWNRVNLLNPVGDLSSSLFGRSTSQNLPRSVTLGARIQF
ncbi:MAG: hypothetical protein JWO80_4261 [Bryobacterales bacterium]|nr:hypothetical protein [Bryobacterales bacterium]